jgi:hypothetical protein
LVGAAPPIFSSFAGSGSPSTPLIGAGSVISAAAATVFSLLTSSSSAQLNRDEMVVFSAVGWFDDAARGPRAVEVLIERAEDKIRRVFGNDAVVKREQFHDPEFGTVQDFIVIETKLPLEAGERMLRQLEDEWWLQAMPEDGSLALGLRYV